MVIDISQQNQMFILITLVKLAGGSTLMLSNIKGPYFEVHSKETVGF